MDKHPVVQLYENRAEEAAAMPEQSDYHALDQGKERTDERHDMVVNLLGPFIMNGRVLDVGCGTGLILDYFAKADTLPKEYIGLDIIDREHDVLMRGCGNDVRSSFHQTAPGVPAIDIDNNFDVALCVGITGFWGMHTYAQNVALFEWMKERAPHGLIVYPMFYSPEAMGVDYLTRFDPDDMAAKLGVDPTFSVTLMEREFIITW